MLANITHKLRSVPESGQWLVEITLFVPFLLTLIGGMFEVSNLLLTQNRVTTAARVATGFGAANYDATEWASANTWATNMSHVAFNNVTETLDLAPELWDIWTVHAQLNPAGNAFDEWNAIHAHAGDVVTKTEWEQMESEIQSDVIDALDPSEKGLEIVATVVFHNRRSLLGFNAVNIGPLNVVRALSVMRLDTLAADESCNAFPIAISAENYSLYPSDSNVNAPYEVFPFDETSNDPYQNPQYYWANKSDGAPMPVYIESSLQQFPANQAGVPLTQAPAHGGHIYLSKQSPESGGGAFGWLRWSAAAGGGGTPRLEASLKYPGNSETYYYPDYHQDGLGLHDIVAVETGAVVSDQVREYMREHADVAGRTLKLPVFTPPTAAFNRGDMDGNGDATILSGGGNHQYEVYGFAIVRVLGWYLPGEHDWFLFEFVRWDNDC